MLLQIAKFHSFLWLNTMIWSSVSWMGCRNPPDRNGSKMSPYLRSFSLPCSLCQWISMHLQQFCERDYSLTWSYLDALTISMAFSYWETGLGRHGWSTAVNLKPLPLLLYLDHSSISPTEVATAQLLFSETTVLVLKHKFSSVKQLFSENHVGKLTYALRIKVL